MIFCTLFDSNYISKGLALYRSLERESCQFEMYIMAMDRKCLDMLLALRLNNVVVECIDSVEDEQLWQAEQNRSRAEFCWTCGSYVTEYFLCKYSLPEIIYIDSDLMFFSSPQQIQDELDSKNASVGLSPHFMDNTLFGKYCVQYVYFRNDEFGRAALCWWKNKCLEWCYSKLEDGKYGDQMYLSYMPDLFERVCEIENRGAGMAYWNVYSSKDVKPIFFHYSGLNVSVVDNVLKAKYSFYLSNDVKKKYILPYLKLLRSVFENDLGIRIGRYSLSPLEPYLYPARCVSHFLERFEGYRILMRALLKVKYAERKNPYSER